MRLSALSLILFFGVAFHAQAQAEEFRCFGQYAEEGSKADLLFYGEVNGSKFKDFRFEFVGDNGFFGSFDLQVTGGEFVKNRRLNISAVTKDGVRYRLTTSHNAKVGNYLGKVRVEREDQSVSFPLRCVILRAI